MFISAHHSDQDFIWREWLKVNKKIGQKSDKRKGGASKKIKKNSTSFMFFCASERAKNNLEGPPREQAKELGRRWRALHVEQREIYHKKAEEDKKRYEEEKKRFEMEEEEGGDEEMEVGEEAEAQGEVEVQEANCEELGQGKVTSIGVEQESVMKEAQVKLRSFFKE